MASAHVRDRDNKSRDVGPNFGLGINVSIRQRDEEDAGLDDFPELLDLGKDVLAGKPNQVFDYQIDVATLHQSSECIRLSHGQKSSQVAFLDVSPVVSRKPSVREAFAELDVFALFGLPKGLDPVFGIAGLARFRVAGSLGDAGES